MLSTKYERVELPHPLFESRSSGIRNNFLEYRTKEDNIFVRQTAFLYIIRYKKAKHILNRHISCSCSNTIYSLSIQKSNF